MRPFVFVGISFVIWRIFLLVFAASAPTFIPVFGERFPYRAEVLQNIYYENWFWPWGNFDGVHYLRIAKEGYEAEFSQAFFPLYPILISNLGNLFGKEYLAAGFLISNISFFLALFFLLKLLSFDYPLSTVKKTIILLLIFPTSFFFGSIYTEGLFLLLIVLSFYFARTNNFFLASISGFFASLTRFFGLFLFPALILEYYLLNKEKITPPYILTSLRSLFWLLLIPAGLGVYMGYLGFSFGDPFYFLTAQPIFGAERTAGEIVLFPQVVWRYLKILFSVSPQTLSFYNALFEFSSTLLFFIFIILAFLRTRLSWALFSLLAFLAPTFTGTFSSMPRYVIILFPSFLLLSSWLKNKYIFGFVCFMSLALLLIWTMLFIRGYWVA